MTALFFTTKRRSEKGFSLMELLVVIVLIGILTGTLAMLTIPRPTPQQAGELAASALEQARMSAIASGETTALLFLSEPNHPDRLNRMLIAQQSDEDESDNTPLWTIVSSPIDLGNGVLLKEEECTSDSSGSAASRMTLKWEGGREGEGLEWIVYGFGGDGVPHQPAGRVVFGRAIDGEFIREQQDAVFILSNNGRPTPVFDFAELKN